jgi:CHAD domain-containing protein
LRQIVANATAVCVGDAEALHQMRIGIRRLRAAIAIFGDMLGADDVEKIKTELRWIMRELGPARDLDVLAAEMPTLPNAEQGTAPHNLEERRAAAYDVAAGAVGSDRFRALLLDLAEWIEAGDWTADSHKRQVKLRKTAVANHARSKLGALRKRIKRKGAKLGELTVVQRHRLRIRAKRLRYATEFFAGTFPGEAAAKCRAESLEALKDMQDALGGLNDIATHHVLLAGDLAAETGEKEGLALHTGLGSDGDRAKGLLRDAGQAYARFAAAKPFWKA